MQITYRTLRYSMTLDSKKADLATGIVNLAGNIATRRLIALSCGRKIDNRDCFHDQSVEKTDPPSTMSV